MNTGTILDRIVETKQIELLRRKIEEPVSDLVRRGETRPAIVDFRKALQGDKVSLIAEIKKASPSRGVFKVDLDPTSLAQTYASNGAAAISVLTEVDHFRGSLGDLVEAKKVADQYRLPVLRKDFIFDPYQVYEAWAYGSDVILLIVAMLEADQVRTLLALAEECGLQAVVEIHSKQELEIAVSSGARIIGVNHRDLRTFEMHMNLIEQLRPLIPTGISVVAESGIHSSVDVQRMANQGADAILVGEALVMADDTAAKVRELAGMG